MTWITLVDPPRNGKQLESNKYTRKYKAELKRLAKAESEWRYDD